MNIELAELITSKKGNTYAPCTTSSPARANRQRPRSLSGVTGTYQLEKSESIAPRTICAGSPGEELRVCDPLTDLYEGVLERAGQEVSGTTADGHWAGDGSDPGGESDGYRQ